MAGTTKRVVGSPHSGIAVVTAIALALIGAALAAVAWGLGAPIHVTVDGVVHSGLPQTETIADLADARFTTAHAGALYSIHGAVLRADGGNPATFLRNGRPVDDTQRVFDGDTITSVNGTDITEHITTTRISIDPTATIEGTGPILKVVRPGTPGLQLLRKGAISGEIESNDVVTPAENIVLQATYPTSTDKLVALTFDDGPWPGTTTATVQVLKQAGVPGTFFELGEQVKRMPMLAKAVVAAGDSVQNQGWSRTYLTHLRPAAVHKQIADAAAAIKAATGVTPRFLRPPFGAINHTVWMQAKEAHEGLVRWDVDSKDYRRPGVDAIVQNVTGHVGRDSIVLLHDGGGPRDETMQALPAIIRWLKANGYTFVTVSQMEAAR